MQHMHIGDRIEAKFPSSGGGGSKRLWVPGTVTGINSDGTYDIVYDGVSLPNSDIRIAENAFSTKDKVSVTFRGEIFRDNSDGTFDVKLSDDHIVKNVRSKDIQVVSGHIDIGTLTSRKEGIESENNHTQKNAMRGKDKAKEPKKSRFSEGTKVECDSNDKGKWLTALISRVRADGTYDVIYDDGKQESKIPAERIRNIHNDAKAGDGSSEDSDSALRVGTKIEARLKGKSRWFPGTIVKVNDNGTFDVEYEDGEKENNVPKGFLRIPRRRSFSGVSLPSFTEGAKVEANYRGKGKWYPGTVSKVHDDGSFDIDYDDGEKETHVDLKLLRALPLTSLTESPNEDTSSELNATSGKAPGAADFKLGDNVEVNAKGAGKWLSGQISKVRSDGLYDVKYGNGEKEEKVKSTNIRLLSDTSGGSDEVLTSREMKKKAQEEADAKLRAALEVGTRIEANYRDKGKWYAGKIAKIRSDGTYLIAYDDGEEENFVFLECIRLPTGDVEDIGDPAEVAAAQTAKTTTAAAIDRAVKSAATKGTSSDIPMEEDKFVEGMSVLVDYKGKGKWYPGKITQVKAGGAACDIAYDDGETELSVPADRIKIVGETKNGATDSEQSKFVTDMKVSVNYKGRGKWHPGKITQVKAGGAACDIAYDDGETELSVPADRIKIVGETKNGATDSEQSKFVTDMKVSVNYKGRGKWHPGKITQVKAGGAACDIAYDDGETELSVPADRIKIVGETNGAADSEQSKFVTDMKVSVNYKGRGKWHPGKITQVKAGGAACDIAYDDGETELSVPADRIKIVSERVAVTETRGKQHMDRRKSMAVTAIVKAVKSAAVEERKKSLSHGKASAAKFVEGMKVKADYKGKGKWYPGKITQVKAGGVACDIAYDDGETELSVSFDRIKIVDDEEGQSSAASAARKGSNGAVSSSTNDSVPSFVKDMSIEANYKGKGKWYPGKIAQTKAGGKAFDIAYDDGETEMNVPIENIRTRESTAASKKASATSAAAAEEATVEGRASTTTKGQVKEKEATWIPEKDMKVEVDYKGKGKWYPGKVKAVKSRDGNGTCDILYDDGETELNVPNARIRPRDTSEPTKKAPVATATASASSKPAAKAGRADVFLVGDRVSVDYKGKGKYYPGKIGKDRGEGIYDIHYDDGEKEANVRAERIKRVESSGESRPAAAASVGDDDSKTVKSSVPKVDTAAAAAAAGDDDDEFAHDLTPTTPRRPDKEKPSSTSTRASNTASSLSPAKVSSSSSSSASASASAVADKNKDRKDRDASSLADSRKGSGGAETSESKQSHQTHGTSSPSKAAASRALSAADEISKFLRERVGMATGAAKKTADAAVARDITTLSQLKSVLQGRGFAFDTLFLTKSQADKIIANISNSDR